MRRALLFALLLPLLAACGSEPAPTQTPVSIVVTATPLPPSATAVLSPTPRPSATSAIPPTLTFEQAQTTAQAARDHRDLATQIAGARSASARATAIAYASVVVPTAVPATSTAVPVLTATPVTAAIRARLEAALRGQATDPQLTATVQAFQSNGGPLPSNIVSAANTSVGFAVQAQPFAYRPSSDTETWVMLLVVQDVMTTGSLTVSPLDFTLETIDGDTVPISTAAPSFAPVTLEPGAHMSGVVGFEIPKSAVMHYLIYRPGSLPGQLLRADFTGGTP